MAARNVPWTVGFLNIALPKKIDRVRRQKVHHSDANAPGSLGSVAQDGSEGRQHRADHESGYYVGRNIDPEKRAAVRFSPVE